MQLQGTDDLYRILEECHRLVNKKYAGGITPEEETELVGLNELLIKILRIGIQESSTPFLSEDVIAITRNWEATSTRHSELIEKKISRTITIDEEKEFSHLHELVCIKRHLAAPLPMQALEEAEAYLRQKGLWK